MAVGAEAVFRLAERQQRRPRKTDAGEICLQSTTASTYAGSVHYVIFALPRVMLFSILGSLCSMLRSALLDDGGMSTDRLA